MADDNTTGATALGTISDMPKLEEVAVGAALVTGAVFVAPTSTPLPTDATSKLDDAFKVLSYTDEGGVTVTESSNKTELRVWEGLALARTLRSGRVEQVKFKPVNINKRVAEVTWGADAVQADPTTGALSIGHHGNPVEPVHLVIETIPFAGAVQRRCFKGQLSELGDVVLNGQDGEGRDLTFDCLALSDGMTMHEYLAYTTD